MRFNFLGGPGTAKSTNAAFIYSELKRKHFSVELATEYVKSWAARKIQIKQLDQVYIFGKQMQYEYRYLTSGVKNIVTDSPTFLPPIYADYYHPKVNVGMHLSAIDEMYEKMFPSVNIFLVRGNEYSSETRYQTLEQAIHIDNLILDKLEKIGRPYVKFPFDDKHAILDYCISKIEA